MFCAAEIKHDTAVFLKLLTDLETLQQTHFHILTGDHSIKLDCNTGFAWELLEIHNAAFKRLIVDG
jgi:hypothetical protein